MNVEIKVLVLTAASIGFIHTLIGPDHYLPFIAIGKARAWNLRKILLLTFLCGLGHIASSIILGFIGIVFGIGILKLEAIEASRGEMAAWLLLIFGFTYFIWGVHHAVRTRPHSHQHPHHGSGPHAHDHIHVHAHTHLHGTQAGGTLTPWILFTIFVFGPCEPLIPILMYPAAQGSTAAVLLVAAVFGITTVATMVGVVAGLESGLARISLGKLERFSHAAAGLIIFASAAAIKFLGL